MFIHAEKYIHTPTLKHILNLSHKHTHTPTNTLEEIRCVGPEPKMIYDPKKN